MEQIEVSEIMALISAHPKEKKSLIPILQDIQAKYNYLPGIALTTLSKTLDIPLIDIIGVATFYRSFSLQPRGEHIITVCLGTACHVRGGPKILEEFEKKLDIEAGETTKDGLFSLETVACLGCCAIGPVIVVDGHYHAQTTIRNVASFLKKYKKNEKNDENTYEN